MLASKVSVKPNFVSAVHISAGVFIIPRDVGHHSFLSDLLESVHLAKSNEILCLSYFNSVFLIQGSVDTRSNKCQNYFYYYTVKVNIADFHHKFH